MKAAQISEFGDAGAIRVVDVEVPRPGEGQVLVEVHAASLNPFDVKVREGYLKKLQLPVTLGGDVAGIVSEVGPGVSGLAVGDAVYGDAGAVSRGSGAFAEYAVTKASDLAKKPSNTDFVQAASLVLVGVCALQAITGHIDLRPGQKILIHGGAGGIGTVAIQIAKRLGAYVATTASGDGMAYAKELGADEVIDYKAERFEEKLRNFDAVFDTIGGETYQRSFKVLKKGGIVVSMLAADPALAEQYGVRTVAQQTHATTKDLEELAKLVEQGAVTPHVGHVYPLADAAQAFRAWEAGPVKGKTVFRIRQD